MAPQAQVYPAAPMATQAAYYYPSYYPYFATPARPNRLFGGLFNRR
jgi:hypothetical protein